MKFRKRLFEHSTPELNSQARNSLGPVIVSLVVPNTDVAQISGLFNPVIPHSIEEHTLF